MTMFSFSKPFDSFKTPKKPPDMAELDVSRLLAGLQRGAVPGCNRWFFHIFFQHNLQVFFFFAKIPQFLFEVCFFPNA